MINKPSNLDNTKPISITEKELISLINTKVRIALRKMKNIAFGQDMVRTRKQVRCFPHETLMIYDNDKFGNDSYRFVRGTGTVYKIIKGDKFDLVYIAFGRTPHEIIVANNIPRRQLLTLKKGHLCEFYGKFRFMTNKNGNKQIVFYALGLMDWFTPIAADFKKVELEAKETNLYENMTDDKAKEFKTAIEEYIQEKENYNYIFMPKEKKQ